MTTRGLPPDNSVQWNKATEHEKAWLKNLVNAILTTNIEDHRAAKKKCKADRIQDSVETFKKFRTDLLQKAIDHLRTEFYKKQEGNATDNSNTATAAAAHGANSNPDADPEIAEALARKSTKCLLCLFYQWF